MKYLVIAGAALLVAILGLATVNIQHHLTIPQELTGRDYVYPKQFINTTFPFIHTAYSIQYNQETHSLNSIRNVTKVLQEAKKGDTITFHLAGYGGEVETMYDLVNNIRKTKAKVIMEVEAPCYSGHAYLAVYGDELYISDFAYLMFHTSSEYNLDCTKEKGTDRGMINIEHCEALKNQDMRLFTAYIINSKILTSEEQVALMNGQDVYIDSRTVRQRSHNEASF